ncbi:MAG: hypothetical protein LBU04_02220 [Christensenellaceae bacterium]|nr:hypothetical protein [Christensenellaceae bacterium]
MSSNQDPKRARIPPTLPISLLGTRLKQSASPYWKYMEKMASQPNRFSYIDGALAYNYDDVYSDQIRTTETRPAFKKRSFFILLTLLLAVLFSAILVLSYLELPGTAAGEETESGEETELNEDVAVSFSLSFFKLNGIDISLKDIVNGMLNNISRASKNTEDSENAEGTENIETSDSEQENQLTKSIFGDNGFSLLSPEEVPVMRVMVIWAIPVTISCSLILALMLILFSILGLVSKKRLKPAFVLVSILLLIVSLVGVIAGYMWNGFLIEDGLVVSEAGNNIGDYIMGSFGEEATAGISLGFASYGFLGVPIILLVVSLLTYGKKQKIS